MIHSLFERLLRIGIVIALAALLSNCGLKGDLYLPEPDKVSEQATPDPTSTDQSGATGAFATNGTAEDQEEKARAKQPSDKSNQP